MTDTANSKLVNDTPEDGPAEPNTAGRSSNIDLKFSQAFDGNKQHVNHTIGVFESVEYKPERMRFVVLLLFVLINITNNTGWICMAPIYDKLEFAYGWTIN